MIAVPIPCLESSSDCLNQLSEAAVAHSQEIDSIDDRLELVGKQVNRQYERRWTAIIPAVADLIDLNPFRLIETLFGGGGFREVDLRIADLEVRTSDLIRRRAEVTVQIHTQVTELVLATEKSSRLVDLLTSQLASHTQRVAVMEAEYRTGEGSTEQMIGLWQQGENLEAKLTEADLEREHSIRRLLELTGYEAATTDEMDSFGSDRPVVAGRHAALESRSSR